MKHILELLKMSDWHAVSENVDIAKGKYKLETTIKGKMKQEKRRKAWR
jgi:extradiol dioxygenase family protein